MTENSDLWQLSLLRLDRGKVRGAEAFDTFPSAAFAASATSWEPSTHVSLWAVGRAEVFNPRAIDIKRTTGGQLSMQNIMSGMYYIKSIL